MVIPSLHLIVSADKPRYGDFFGSLSSFAFGAPITVDGKKRGFVLGVQELWRVDGFWRVFMIGDDSQPYYAYYRPNCGIPSHRLSFRLYLSGGVGDFLDTLLASHGFHSYGDPDGINRVRPITP